MATYNWRVLNGVFSDPNSWTNITTGQDPATTPPGAVDAANFVGASTGTITGTGNVLSLAFNADGTWTLSGPTTSITAANILVNDRTTIANGGALILASTQHTSGTELTIAQGTGSTGTLTVDGAGTTVNTNGYRITDGADGRGDIEITHGAKVMAGSSGYPDTEAALALGAHPGSQGILNIAGAGSQLVANGEVVIGGTDTGSGPTSGGFGEVLVSDGAILQTTGSMFTEGNSLLSNGGNGTVLVQGNLTAGSGVGNSGFLQVSGTVSGTGALNLNGGFADLGTLAGLRIAYGAADARSFRVHALSGATIVQDMHFTDSIDLDGMAGVVLNGNTITAGGGSLNLSPAPAGYAYKLYGTPSGGTQLLLNPTSPPAGAISFTDVTTNTSNSATGDEYSGPITYLQRDYIASGPDSHAIRANVPNALLQGNTSADALQATGGNNVLDGGAGSSFLVGSLGTNGGVDSFSVDARNGVTWDTFVNFRLGDEISVVGFQQGLSTMPFTASDGVAGFTGATIHSELNGAGTGVNASLTFAGIDLATAQQHFVYTFDTQGGAPTLHITYA